MPAKYKVKDFQPGETYYIYSTAEEDRNIFEDEVDYDYWRQLMVRYVGGVFTVSEDGRYKSERPYRTLRKKEMALPGEVKILAYCLMRKGVYMLVWQKNVKGITKLMRRMITNYTMYSNRRHRKRGKVFAGVYKGVRIPTGRKLVFLSRWIHRLPGMQSVRRFGLVETLAGFNAEEYMYSSYANFKNNQTTEWLEPEKILTEFNKLPEGQEKTYKQFVDEDIGEQREEREIGDLLY